MKCIILILTILLCTSVLSVSALENKTPADRDMDTMIHLLKESGVDISYGEEGDIFSMVEKSLHQIISSLASGNVEGFMDIPLIRETLGYFGLTADDIVISPEDTDSRMDAIDMYERKYDSMR